MSEKRDPRAGWLDEDPFDKMSNNSKTHTRARDDGNWRKPILEWLQEEEVNLFSEHSIYLLNLKESLFIEDQYGIFQKPK